MTRISFFLSCRTEIIATVLGPVSTGHCGLTRRFVLGELHPLTSLYKESFQMIVRLMTTLKFSIRMFVRLGNYTLTLFCCRKELCCLKSMRGLLTVCRRIRNSKLTAYCIWYVVAEWPSILCKSEYGVYRFRWDGCRRIHLKPNTPGQNPNFIKLPFFGCAKTEKKHVLFPGCLSLFNILTHGGISYLALTLLALISPAYEVCLIPEFTRCIVSLSCTTLV